MTRTRICFFVLLCLVVSSTFVSLTVVAQNPDLSPDVNEVIKDAIVKIYTVSNSPDYLNPWRMRGARQSNGSGCIITGNRILTNAHVIANHTFIQVRRYGQAKRYKARLLDVSHDADLAVLTIEDESFFEGIIPLEFGELPETQQEVVVYGFPLGGDSLSITKGVLSRLEHNYYVHSGQYLLAGQIDAAINPGNSGGPVIVDGKVVGVVMQSLKAQKIESLGYMVPIPVVKHFFTDIADGVYDGFPNLGITTQPLENPDMKRKYGLNESQTGLLVNRIFPGSPAAGKLTRGDILLAIEGASVADDGTIEFRPKERTSYTYFVDGRQVGTNISVEIFRENGSQILPIELSRTQGEYRLVPAEQYETLPRFFIYGGIVFTPLTKNLLKQYGGNWPNNAPSQLVSELGSWVTEERQEIVLALRLLAADVNQGYHDLFAWIVTEVDGQSFKDFDEFYQLVMESEEPYLVLRDEDYFELVLDRQKADESHESILKTYRIEQDRSPDLRAD
ncbi:MAG: serine protease [bacterium]|nr:serine protease [bacterium]